MHSPTKQECKLVPSKKPQPACKYTPDQAERAFSIAEQIWSSPYAETLLTDPKAMQRVALRSLEFVVLFDEQVMA